MLLPYQCAPLAMLESGARISDCENQRWPHLLLLKLRVLTTRADIVHSKYHAAEQSRDTKNSLRRIAIAARFFTSGRGFR
jgi:hypothetical protein